MTKATITIIMVALLLASACGGFDTAPVTGGTGGTDGNVCDPGDIIDATCVGDRDGTRECLPDGSGYGPCIPGSMACLPGQTTATTCPNGQEGTQTCKPDGSGFESCVPNNTEPGNVCVPGQVTGCTASNGKSGSQVCKSDGSGYEACVAFSGGNVCVPGQSVNTTCPNGQAGSQTCNSAGSGFNECVPFPPSGGTGGNAGTGGNTGVGGGSPSAATCSVTITHTRPLDLPVNNVTFNGGVNDWNAMCDMAFNTMEMVGSNMSRCTVTLPEGTLLLNIEVDYGQTALGETQTVLPSKTFIQWSPYELKGEDARLANCPSGYNSATGRCNVPSEAYRAWGTATVSVGGQNAPLSMVSNGSAGENGGANYSVPINCN